MYILLSLLYSFSPLCVRFLYTFYFHFLFYISHFHPRMFMPILFLFSIFNSPSSYVDVYAFFTFNFNFQLYHIVCWSLCPFYSHFQYSILPTHPFMFINCSLLFSILPPRLLMFMIIFLLLSLSIFNFTPSAADGYAHFSFYFQFYLLIPWCLMFMPI